MTSAYRRNHISTTQPVLLDLYVQYAQGLETSCREAPWQLVGKHRAVCGGDITLMQPDWQRMSLCSGHRLEAIPVKHSAGAWQRLLIKWTSPARTLQCGVHVISQISFTTFGRPAESLLGVCFHVTAHKTNMCASHAILI